MLPTGLHHQNPGSNSCEPGIGRRQPVALAGQEPRDDSRGERLGWPCNAAALGALRVVGMNSPPNCTKCAEEPFFHAETHVIMPLLSRIKALSAWGLVLSLHGENVLSRLRGAVQSIRPGYSTPAQ